ncbi:MAG: hypothetical protein HKN15_04940, partial [Xanthomonadales bacterium]|nr:hypothetical protein [Xanthomonadales bacterium]
MAILFVTGVNDQGLLKVYQDENLQMQFEIDGSCNVINKIDLGRIPKMPVLI